MASHCSMAFYARSPADVSVLIRPPLMARRLALALALAAAAASPGALGSSSSASSSGSGSSSGPLDCPRTRTALTSACLGRCFAGRPCIAFAGANASASSDTSGRREEETCEASALSSCTSAQGGVCALECFTNGPDDFAAQDAVGFSAYTFLVPLAGDDTVGDTGEHPSKSNEVLRRVEALELLDVTTKVCVFQSLYNHQELAGKTHRALAAGPSWAGRAQTALAGEATSPRWSSWTDSWRPTRSSSKCTTPAGG